MNSAEKHRGSPQTYVATNSIHHLTNGIRHLDSRFSNSNFERSVLGCIDADNLGQIVVGKIALDEIYAFHIFLVAFPFNILQKAQTFSKTIFDKISSTNC